MRDENIPMVHDSICIQFRYFQSYQEAETIQNMLGDMLDMRLGAGEKQLQNY